MYINIYYCYNNIINIYIYIIYNNIYIYTLIICNTLSLGCFPRPGSCLFAVPRPWFGLLPPFILDITLTLTLCTRSTYHTPILT